MLTRGEEGGGGLPNSGNSASSVVSEDKSFDPPPTICPCNKEKGNERKEVICIYGVDSYNGFPENSSVLH